MKFLYHHRTLSSDGQDVHIREMVSALSRRGHEVILVGPAVSRTHQNNEGGRSSRIRDILPRAIAELLEFAYSALAFVQLFRAWKAHRPDVIYERYNLLLMSGAWLKAVTGIPLMLEVNAPLVAERMAHGGLAWPSFAKFVERQVWRQSDVVLPVTHVLAREVEHAGVPGANIRVIANGADTEQVSLPNEAEELRRDLGLSGKLVLGFAGFIRSWHGLTRVVEAMAALPDRPELRLVVVGDGPGRVELEARARLLNMTDRVIIIGVVERNKVKSYIATFDIALQPHAVAYASPLKLFEYMAAGRAIIAPDQPNIREILENGANALLFDPRDARGFEKAIDHLCANPAFRARLGAKAAQTIDENRYSWNGNAERVEKIASSLVNRPPADDVASRNAFGHPSATRRNDA